ncbi:MFS transporter [Arthrobacter sp. B2a2-09]|uniref:MFS transporter n=1 Tax=Arthrobacter sp. B2a2-09 TaxID=2952822 RepID=UPI0022CD8A56|nr:MFS transporter [Arthrobacter sp. B2a2-09]MCZ9883620.1 MHS family MFS transporter [Arthrobacter sp. B2a2-09]
MSTVDLEKASEPDLHFQTPEGRARFRTATISTWLGTTMEYVDFALYGLAAGLIFGNVFFPGSSPVIALLSGFATYAVGFLARPLGAIYFGRLGDKRGRKFVLVATVALMGVSTTLIGLIPGYDQIGMAAPALLVLLRLAQGFGAGAELSGGAVMLAEYAPAKRRGLVASIVALGSNSGTLLASAIWLLIVQLPQQDLLSWGWRIPFIGSFIITAAALLIRRSMSESPVFLKQQELLGNSTEARASKPAGTFWSRRKAFFIMVGLRIGENGPSYLAQSFVIGYVAKVLLVDKSVPTSAVLIASILGFGVIPLAGLLSDRFGRRLSYRVFCLLLVLYAVPAFALLDTRDPAIVMVVIIVGMCLASLGIFGVQAAYGVELFGANHRYSQMALAKELGSIVSGGTAPLVAAALLAGFGHWWPIAAYFILMAGIGLVTTFYAPETKGRDLNEFEDAV